MLHFIGLIHLSRKPLSNDTSHDSRGCKINRSQVSRQVSTRVPRGGKAARGQQEGGRTLVGLSGDHGIGIAVSAGQTATAV